MCKKSHELQLAVVAHVYTRRVRSKALIARRTMCAVMPDLIAMYLHHKAAADKEFSVYRESTFDPSN